METKIVERKKSKSRFEYLNLENILRENPLALCIFDEDIRSNRRIVSFATKYEKLAIQFASKKVLEDSLYVFKTQDYDVNNLKNLLLLFPEIKTPKLQAIVDVYNKPIDFSQFPEEYYDDIRFINACKISIAQKVKEELFGERVATENQIRWAQDIEDLVSTTIQLHDLKCKSIIVSDKNKQYRNIIINKIKSPILTR